VRKIEPSYRERVWGTTTLEPWFANQEETIGEVWFENGGELPLLVKFLFTSEKLSVQVHPDDAVARTRHNSLGKTEMWHILAVEPGAKIAAGFREPVSQERMRSAALSGEIDNLLEWHDARPGDTFFIPPGTVHAIGPGITLCEIQQSSDITYRLYDYGRGRELHLDEGISVSRGDRHGTLVEWPVSCEHFNVDRLRIDSLLRHDPGGAQELIVLEGIGAINGSAIKAGEVWMIDEPVELDGAMTILTAR
jgi:mannose-6-phosphate isomerase